MNKSRVLIVCMMMVLMVLSGCSSDGGSGTTDPDGDDVVTDGDAPVADGDTSDGVEPSDGDTTPDGDEEPDEDGDTVDGDTPTDGDEPTDGDQDGDAADGDEPDGDITDGDMDGDISDGDVEADGDVETQPTQAVTSFNGFTASGGSAANVDYHLIFRLAPAALTIKASNSAYRLNATITPKSN